MLSGGKMGTPDGVIDILPPWWYIPVKASILTNGSAPPWVFAGDFDPDPQEWAEYIVMTVSVEAEVKETKQPKTPHPPRQTRGQSSGPARQAPARSTTFHVNRGQGPVTITEN